MTTLSSLSNVLWKLKIQASNECPKEHPASSSSSCPPSTSSAQHSDVGSSSATLSSQHSEDLEVATEKLTLQNICGSEADVEEPPDTEDEVKRVLSRLELVWYSNSCLSKVSVPEEHEAENETALVQVE
nr:hypothetical protein Itr_chr06CG02200 [Ipomoea trifida]